MKVDQQQDGPADIPIGTQALEVTDRDLMSHPHFVFTGCSLRIDGVPDFDQCAIFATRLGRVTNALPFAVGDFVIYLESRFGEKASQIVDRDTFAGLAEESIRGYKWCSERIAPANRNPRLTFKHHQIVAALTPIEQKEWLDRAENNGDPWPTSRLAAALRESDPNTPVKAIWAEVRCKDLADYDAFREGQEKEGRFVKLREQRERRSKKKEITAKGKKTKRKTARSKG